MGEIEKTLSIAVHHPQIDTIHAELASLVVALAESPETEFTSLYSELISHTEAHFAHEEKLMCENGFPHAAEHLSEHRQMLQEMKQFMRRNAALSRAYIVNRLPERFKLHIIRMDSLLVAWLHKH